MCLGNTGYTPCSVTSIIYQSWEMPLIFVSCLGSEGGSRSWEGTDSGVRANLTSPVHPERGPSMIIADSSKDFPTILDVIGLLGPRVALTVLPGLSIQEREG